MLPQHPPEWTVLTDWEYNGRRLYGGITQITISGEKRGRRLFTFQQYICTPDGREWVDAQCVKSGLDRAFRPERIETVHKWRQQ